MCNREGVDFPYKVYIPEQDVEGMIVGGLGAYFTTISYVKGGLVFEVLMENNEFELMEDGLIEYDDD